MRLIENGSRQYFLKLLETASATVRAKLESADPQAAAAIRDTIDDVATTMQHEVRNASDQYIAAMRDAKRRFNVRPFTEANIHAPARAQEFEPTVIRGTGRTRIQKRSRIDYNGEFNHASGVAARTPRSPAARSSRVMMALPSSTADRD